MLSSAFGQQGYANNQLIDMSGDDRFLYNNIHQIASSVLQTSVGQRQIDPQFAEAIIREFEINAQVYVPQFRQIAMQNFRSQQIAYDSFVEIVITMLNDISALLKSVPGQSVQQQRSYWPLQQQRQQTSVFGGFSSPPFGAAAPNGGSSRLSRAVSPQSQVQTKSAAVSDIKQEKTQKQQPQKNNADTIDTKDYCIIGLDTVNDKALRGESFTFTDTPKTESSNTSLVEVLGSGRFSGGFQIVDHKHIAVGDYWTEVRHAIQLVRQCLPKIFASENYCHEIEYKILTVDKVSPGCAEELLVTQAKLSKSIDALRTLSDFAEHVVPVLTEVSAETRQYYHSKIFTVFNQLASVRLFHPTEPDMRLFAASHPRLSVYFTPPTDVDSATHDRVVEYITTMQSKYGVAYGETVFQCLKQSLNETFSTKLNCGVLDIRSAGLRYLAGLPELVLCVGDKLPRHFSGMTEDEWNQMASAISKHYVIHSALKHVVVTNLDVQRSAPHPVRTLIRSPRTELHWVLSQLCESVRTLLLIGYDKSNSSMMVKRGYVGMTPDMTQLLISYEKPKRV